MHGSERYRFGDIVIASELPIADLPTATVVQSDWLARVESIMTPAHVDSYHTWCDATGQPVVHFARFSQQRIIDFGATARFLVDAELRVIACEPGEATPLTVVSQLLAHEVLPLVVGLERLTLHASAVAADGGAIAFAGASGAGKSTLAVRLAQKGWSLLTDDVTVVDTETPVPRIVPMGAPVRLWNDSIEELFDASTPSCQVGDSGVKRSVTAAAACITHANSPIPLRALFLLDDTVADVMGPVEPRAAVAAVLKHAFVLATDDVNHAAHLFDAVSRTVRAVRVYRLPIPAGFDQLDRIVDCALRATSR